MSCCSGGGRTGVVPLTTPLQSYIVYMYYNINAPIYTSYIVACYYFIHYTQTQIHKIELPMFSSFFLFINLYAVNES